VYEDTIINGSDATLCASIAVDCYGDSVVSTEPGNVVSGTRDGTDYRLEHTSSSCDSWDEVVTLNTDGEQVLDPDCNPFLTGGSDHESLQVILIPVVAQLCNGACYTTIDEFSLFFLEGYGDGGCTGNVCEIKGRFIQSNTNIGALMGVFDPDSFSNFVRLVE
jgi:hypothetical protein